MLVKLERMDEAKDVLDQAKRKGVQGISFDQIEKTLFQQVLIILMPMDHLKKNLIF